MQMLYYHLYIDQLFVQIIENKSFKAVKFVHEHCLIIVDLYMSHSLYSFKVFDSLYNVPHSVFNVVTRNRDIAGIL
jgi:hypothetical protein